MTQRLTTCPECDLLQKIPHPVPLGEVVCVRCGCELYCHNPTGIDHSLALMWGVTILFILANLFPIITLEAQGQERSASLIDAVQTLWQEDMKLVAGLVLFTTLLAPGLEILGLTYVLSCVKFRWGFPGLRALMRVAVSSRPWSMVEVFMLGILVSVVKLSHLAHISPGVALWSYGLMILLFAAAMAKLDTHLLWDTLTTDE